MNLHEIKIDEKSIRSFATEAGLRKFLAKHDFSGVRVCIVRLPVSMRWTALVIWHSSSASRQPIEFTGLGLLTIG